MFETISKNLIDEYEQNERHFRAVYFNLNQNGVEAAPRGLKIKEIENCAIVFPPYVRFANFEVRKLNLDYIKREFLWYLKGDKYDTSICQYAKIWNDCINEDGTINSNYGYYIFGELNQFDYVVSTLFKDKDSRRAVMVILQPYHLLNDKMKEVPCTYNISFRIRADKLNMTVKMRSQDAILGFGSDIPTFSFIHEMLLKVLQFKYPELEYGDYVHFVDSFHCYERHYDMLEQIVQGSPYSLIYCPKISGIDEVDYLRKLDFTLIPREFQFTTWLTTFSDIENK